VAINYFAKEGDQMNIELNFEGNIAFMKIDGVVSSDNAYMFQEKLNAVLDTDSTMLELDLSACSNISSSGIGKLLIFYKEFMTRNGEIEVVKSSPGLYELFTTIKLDQLFTINL